MKFNIDDLSETLTALNAIFKHYPERSMEFLQRAIAAKIDTMSDELHLAKSAIRDSVCATNEIIIPYHIRAFMVGWPNAELWGTESSSEREFFNAFKQTFLENPKFHDKEWLQIVDATNLLTWLQGENDGI